MASERPEEEELWLYGDSPICDEENSSTPRHDQSPDTLQNISTERTETNNVSLQVSQSESDDEENSDTDSDDDVMVTIGDIKTGASSCIGSAGNVKSGKGYNASGKLPPKGIDFSAPGCINGVPVLDADLDSFDDKPWRKPGADISDYFNYGFNEATWKVYCEKQRRLQMGLDPGYRSNCRENKITVLQGRMGGTTKGGENGDLNAVYVKEENSTVTSPSRKTEETTDGIGSVICNITTVQGRRWDSHDSEEISIQVLDDHAYKPPAPIHQQPPPPLLPPPPNMIPNPHPFHSIPPPHFFHRPPAATHLLTPSLQPPALLPPPLLPPPSVHIPPVNGPPISYNSRPHQRQNYNSTESHIISYQPPVSTTHSPWVTTVNKSTNSFSGNDWVSRRQRERETDRARSLATSNYKNEGDHYQHYHRERSYEQERKYQRSGERPREQSWEKEEKPRGEHRTRDREESSKHKSSRHIQDSEERESREERESHESHKRHKRKKSKRGKEDKIKSEDKGEGSRRSHRD